MINKKNKLKLPVHIQKYRQKPLQIADEVCSSPLPYKEFQIIKCKLLIENKTKFNGSSAYYIIYFNKKATADISNKIVKNYCYKIVISSIK
jgi:hypothetical protein